MTSATDNSQKRVLIVDDSKFVRTTFNRILSASFAVVEATDGDSAWQTLQKDDSIVMVFTDLDMPKLDGFGLLRLIRGAKQERVRKMPVVVISGSQDQGARSRAKVAGASDFISKSAEATDVLARIGELLKAVAPDSQSQGGGAAVAATAAAVAAAAVAAAAAAPAMAAAAGAAPTAQTQPPHDPLTGAHNSQSLLNEGRKHFSYSQRHGSPLSVMAFRVDSYAQTSRDAGKEVSDQVLARIAKMILGVLRTEDSFGRVGESTFVVISAGAAAAQMLAFARRLYAQLDAAQVRHGKQLLKIRTSFGVASIGGASAASIEDLMKLALQRVQLASTRPSDPIVGDEPAAPAAAAPSDAQPSEVERALAILERAASERPADAEQLARRLRAVLKVLESSRTEEKIAA